MYDWRAEWQERFARTEPKIICVGLNYKDHARRGRREETAHIAHPVRQVRHRACATTATPSSCPRASATSTPRPSSPSSSAASATRSSADDALDFVHGYTCGNDVAPATPSSATASGSAARPTTRSAPSARASSRSPSSARPADLRVVQRLNGETLQDGRTSQLIFGVRELVSFTSHVLTLLPGDLILTGTPAGVGVFRDPKISMKPGDVAEVEVEGIGVLRNPVEATEA